MDSRNENKYMIYDMIWYKSWYNTMYKCRNRAEHSEHFWYV